jgi:hypothetical protein
MECCYDAQNMDPNDWVEKWLIYEGELQRPKQEEKKG